MPPSKYSNRSRISFTTPKVWAKETCRLLHHYWLPKKRFDMRSIFISASHPRSRHLRASPQWSSQRRRVRQGTSWYPCSSLWSTVGSEQRTETRLRWSCPTNTSGQFNNFRSIIFWLLQSWEIFTCTISSSFCDLLFSTVTPGCILTFKGKQMF